MSDKLPEWPKKPWGCTNENIWAHYYSDTTIAALARMEALVKELRIVRKECRLFPSDIERIDELLAACERSER